MSTDSTACEHEPRECEACGEGTVHESDLRQAEAERDAAADHALAAEADREKLRKELEEARAQYDSITKNAAAQITRADAAESHRRKLWNELEQARARVEKLLDQPPHQRVFGLAALQMRADRADAAEATVKAQAERVDEALGIASRYGGIDGEHHKAWVIDQVVRALTGDGYAAWLANQKAGEDGPETYDWPEGIAP